MISKFHKLIQSKTIWAIILTIIIIAFVGLYIRWPGQDERDQATNSAGQLNGEYINRQEFSRARMNTYLSFVMMIGRQPTMTKELDERMNEAAWKRLANIRKADEMGLTAGNAEVVATIQHHPGFQHEGRYNANMYSQFVNRYLRTLGVSEVQFEEYIREEIALQKLRSMINHTAMVAPYELQRTFSMLMDSFDIEFAEVTTNTVADNIDLSDEDVALFFQDDPERFMIPEKVVVRYISLPLSNYMDSASVTEEDAHIYYDENLDDFTETIFVTNMPTFALGSETNIEPQITEEEKTLTFEDVQEEITETLVHAAAREKAVDRATDIVIDLTPDRNNQAASFEELAAKYEMDIQTLPAFTLREKLDEIDADTFNQAAFGLQLNKEECYSDAIEGDNFVYVIYLDERQKPRIPEFDEVAEQVREKAELEALTQALIDEAQSLREDAMEKIAEGETFASVVKAHHLELEVMTNLNAMATMDETEEGELLQEILRAVLVQNEGEVAELLPLQDSIMVTYVAKRHSGDPIQYTSFRPQITATIKRERTRNLFAEWEDYLLSSGNFTTRKDSSSTSDSTPEEDEEQQDTDQDQKEAS